MSRVNSRRFIWICLSIETIPFLFLTLTRFVRHWSLWFEPGNHVVRAQTDAFLKGRFVLFEKPIISYIDLAWNNGVQQVWGLGVPFLCLPFEVLAKLFWRGYFPDHLTFLFYFTVVSAAAIIIQLRQIPEEEPHFSKNLVGRLTIVLIFLFSPPLMGLLRHIFRPYEETVCYGYLCSVLLLQLLLLFHQEGRYKIYLGLAFLSGFAIMIRPTLALTGGVTVAMAFLSPQARSLSRLKRWTGPLILVLFGVLLMATNLQRFGAPFEFGHSINLNSLTPNTYSLKFDYPFRHEPIVRAAKELMGALFFIPNLNGQNFYDVGFFRGQSPTFRFREFYSSFYDPGVAMLVLAGTLLGLWALVKQKFHEISLVTCWGLAIFFLMSAFYLRSPSLTSRYLLDFLPALNALLAVIPLSLLKWRSRNQNVSTIGKSPLYFSGALFVLWIGFSLHRHQFELHPQTETALWTEKQVRTQMAALYQEQLHAPVLPETYHRADDMPALRIRFNGEGWIRDESGRVEQVVQLFFKDPSCLTLIVEPPMGRVVPNSDYENIQVKVGLEFMRKVSDQPKGHQRILTFELNPGSRYRTGIQLVFIGFVRPEDLGKRNSPLLLQSVSRKCEVS